MEIVNIVSAYCLDLWAGDPEGFPHPVRLMGKIIGFLDNRLNKRARSKWGERINGALAALATVGISAALACLLIQVARGVNPWLGNLVCIYLG
ncbi:MAG: cobalamin biosynthesis protein, partial [Candidatus Omnitrophota bacterium]